jgi:hypothetical protein
MVKEGQNIPEDAFIPLEKIEILSFDSLEKAERFAETLKGSGYRPLILTEPSGDQHLHRVFILIDQGEQYVPAGFSSGQPVVAYEKAAPVQDQDKERNYEAAKKPSWDILGRQNRHVHGSLAVSGIYTDNVLNSRDDKKSDFSTVLSPALWVTIPNTNENIAPAVLMVRSPGGSLLSRQWPDSLFHYQASLYYRTDIPLTSSSGHLAYGTTPAQTLSGRLLIKGNRLSLLAEDLYQFSYHEQEAGTVIKPGEQNRYNANYFSVALSYETRRRFVLSGGYINFLTRYRSDLSDFRNRMDNGMFGVLTYKLSPRVRLLAEYRFFDISYEHSDVLESREHYFLGGISWDITAKSKGLFKAGYEVKDFDHSLGNYQDFSFELQLDHRFTPKTSVTASAYRKPNETDLSGMVFSLTNGFDVRLNHTITPRLTSTVGFLVENDDYKRMQGLTENADSTTYQESVALRYAFRRWIEGTVGYAYTRKDASLSELEYNSNTLFFSVRTSL